MLRRGDMAKVEIAVEGTHITARITETEGMTPEELLVLELEVMEEVQRRIEHVNAVVSKEPPIEVVGEVKVTTE
jgi:hypothetical protein